LLSMILKEIVEELEAKGYHSEHGSLEMDLAFQDLKLIASQHPGMCFVQWWECHACDTPAHNLCCSPFEPDECIGGTSHKAKWEKVPDIP